MRKFSWREHNTVEERRVGRMSVHTSRNHPCGKVEALNRRQRLEKEFKKIFLVEKKLEKILIY
jgi:hypothetical protein